MPCNATLCDNADNMILYKRITVPNSLNKQSHSDAPCALKILSVRLLARFATVPRVLHVNKHQCKASCHCLCAFLDTYSNEANNLPAVPENALHWQMCLQTR